MRAIEVGLPLLRATNDGVTALVSPTGVILSELRERETGSVREPGFILGEIELTEPRTTFYTCWGNWVVWISCGFVLMGLRGRRDAA